MNITRRMTKEYNIVMQRIVRMILQRISRRNHGLKADRGIQVVQFRGAVFLITRRIVILVRVVRGRRPSGRFRAPIRKGNVAIGSGFLNAIISSLVARGLFNGRNNDKVFHQATVGRRRNCYRFHADEWNHNN